LSVRHGIDPYINLLEGRDAETILVAKFRLSSQGYQWPPQNLSQIIIIKSTFEVPPMACGEHDRPDPSLIVEGT